MRTSRLVVVESERRFGNKKLFEITRRRLNARLHREGKSERRWGSVGRPFGDRVAGNERRTG
jgi:hypothetical protein